jgi:hypothetical protein
MTNTKPITHIRTGRRVRHIDSQQESKCASINEAKRVVAALNKQAGYICVRVDRATITVSKRTHADKRRHWNGMRATA